jgi:predicted secreted Zn-dependent protease
VIKASYFGPNVILKSYTVKGTTPAAIIRSIGARGPYSDWIGERAEAMTQSDIEYAFSFTTFSEAGACEIYLEDTPAITQTYVVILPKWAQPRAASAATIRWWSAELLLTAKHEKVHVQYGVKATKAANLALASSTCDDAEDRLDAVWYEQSRQNCVFDMREYGKESGLTLEDCLSW